MDLMSYEGGRWLPFEHVLEEVAVTSERGGLLQSFKLGGEEEGLDVAILRVILKKQEGDTCLPTPPHLPQPPSTNSPHWEGGGG